MRRTIFSLILVTVLAGSIIFTGCSAQSPGTGSSQVQTLTVAGGSIGGSKNVIANAHAGVLKKFAGIDATVLTYNMGKIPEALGSGDVDIGMGDTQQSYPFYNAEGVWKGNPPIKGLRAITPIDVGSMQIFVPVDSPIKTFRDLVGKRICPQAPGVAQWNILEQGLPAIGLNLNKDFQVTQAGWTEASSLLVSGKLDAVISSSQPPHVTFMETDLTRPLRLIGFTEADNQAISKAVSGMIPAVIPPKFYHMTEPVSVPAYVGFSMAMSNFSEDTIYKLVKSFYENLDYVGYYRKEFRDFLEDKQAGAKYWIEANSDKTIVPFHAGAVRYYQEIGWKVTPNRIPPEAIKTK